jgi:hypothetical protein
VPKHLRKRKGEIISTKPCLPKAVIRFKKKKSRFPHHGPKIVDKAPNILDHRRELAAVRHQTATEKAVVGVLLEHCLGERAYRSKESKENNQMRQRIMLANREK